MREDMTVEEKLAVDKFHVDEEFAHIEVDKDGDAKVIDRLVKLCPAGLYVRDENGELTFDYAGCLECGTCLVAGKGTVVKSWNYPRGGMGVEFRLG
ncbi:ferredoxin family protein [Adlercreutzia murintestinalis]|uniref:ferredoxin family protein n=1 Tax=Adlercreutzia murintestinalis TaxID=2941325 RepID=UPI0032E386EB